MVTATSSTTRSRSRILGKRYGLIAISGRTRRSTRRLVKDPKNAVTAAGLQCESLRHGEERALVGGTTSIQGTPEIACVRSLVRNIEGTNFCQDRIRQNVTDIAGLRSVDLGASHRSPRASRSDIAQNPARRVRRTRRRGHRRARARGVGPAQGARARATAARDDPHHRVRRGGVRRDRGDRREGDLVAAVEPLAVRQDGGHPDRGERGRARVARRGLGPERLGELARRAEGRGPRQPGPVARLPDRRGARRHGHDQPGDRVSPRPVHRLDRGRQVRRSDGRDRAAGRVGVSQLDPGAPARRTARDDLRRSTVRHAAADGRARQDRRLRGDRRVRVTARHRRHRDCEGRHARQRNDGAERGQARRGQPAADAVDRSARTRRCASAMAGTPLAY